MSDIRPTRGKQKKVRSMNERILVAYATKAGSTAEVAEVIGQVLRETGATVDVLPARAVEDLTPYRAVIIGSAVRMERIQIGRAHV